MGIGTIVLFLAAGAIVAVSVIIVSRQIVRPVVTMAGVAESIEKEEFDTGPLQDIIARQDEIGVLARVFSRMAKEVYQRVEKLKQRVKELQIVVDERKVAEEVSQIVDSDYFRDLQSKAKTLRNRSRRSSSTSAGDETPS